VDRSSIETLNHQVGTTIRDFPERRPVFLDERAGPVIELVEWKTTPLVPH